MKQYSFLMESRRTILKHLNNGDISLGSLIRLQKIKRQNSNSTLIPTLKDDLKKRFIGQLKRGQNESRKRGEKLIVKRNLSGKGAHSMSSPRYFGYDYKLNNDISKPSNPLWFFNNIRERNIKMQGNPYIDLGTKYTSNSDIAELIPQYFTKSGQLKKKILTTKNPKTLRKLEKAKRISDLDLLTHETNEHIQRYKQVEFYKKLGYSDSKIKELIKKHNDLQKGISRHNPGVLDKDFKWYDEFLTLHGHEGFKVPIVRSKKEINLNQWRNIPR